MSNQPTASLTGVWQGRYVYNIDMEPVAFTATLIESGGLISGTTHEPGQAIGLQSQSAHGVLNGSRDGAHVLFTKSYEQGHKQEIEYDGMVNADATKISGNWIIFGDHGGSFQMIRASSKAAAVERKASVKIK